jgi:hypothetical protein
VLSETRAGDCIAGRPQTLEGAAALQTSLVACRSGGCAESGEAPPAKDRRIAGCFGIVRIWYVPKVLCGSVEVVEALALADPGSPRSRRVACTNMMASPTGTDAGWHLPIQGFSDLRAA